MSSEDQEEDKNKNALVVKDGFPALFAVRNDRKEPLLEENESTIPRQSFASYKNAIDVTSPQHVRSLLDDCTAVFSARTKDDGAAYSAGCTYFVPCQMKPRCALEALALQIFRKHVEELDERTYDPERSGAEWWTLVLDAATNEQQKSSNTEDSNNSNEDDDKKKKAGSVDNNDDDKKNETMKNNNDSDANRNFPIAAQSASASASVAGNGNTSDNDDDDDDEVGMHFDADYGLESQAPQIGLLHPRIATVTYLSNAGAPTVILEKRSPPSSDKQKKTLGGNIRKGWLSSPSFGKHISFDGRLLHGAPAAFFPPPASSYVDNHSHTPKRQKLSHVDDNRRVTFLVNIWLNHCPLDADLLDDELCQELKTPVESLEVSLSSSSSSNKNKVERTKRDSKEEHEKITENCLKKPSPLRPFEWTTPNLLAPDEIDHSISLSPSLNDPAGTEETVLCNHEVVINFNASLDDLEKASNLTSGGKSALLSFAENALHIDVGKEVESDDEE